MKRAKEDCGKTNAWEQISWEEAFSIIKENYDRITAKYGRESIVVFAGTGRESGTFAPYSSICFGTPNFCYTQSGYACYTPGWLQSLISLVRRIRNGTTQVRCPDIGTILDTSLRKFL